MCTIHCRSETRCCQRTFCPLTLAWARTIKRFQGQSAGPVDEGKIPNLFKCIICDPDERKFEGSALGLLYTAASRGTTFGDDDGLGSAVYFIGKEFDEKRVRAIGTKLKSTDQYERAKKREQWVLFLKQHTHKGTLSQHEREEVLQWASNTKIQYNTLYDRTKKYINAKR